MRKLKSIVFLVLAALLSPGSALAHNPGQSAVLMNLDGDTLQGEIQIYYQDLQPLFPALPEDPAAVTPDILAQHASSIQEFFAKHTLIQIPTESPPRHLEMSSLPNLDARGNVVLPFQIQLEEPSSPSSIKVTQEGLFDKNPQFTTLVIFTTNEDKKTVILTKDRNASELFIDPYAEFFGFLRYGMHHICLGLDHMFFLLLLIFSPFLSSRLPKQKKPLPAVCWQMFKLATAFTISHSLTLLLAVLNIVALPQALVDLLVIASIIFVGINNLFSLETDREWILVFMFGLFHGYGFSTALRNVGLSQGNLAIPLVGFNVGVEAGQILVILITLLPLYVLYLRWDGTIRLIRAFCAAITLIAGIWMLEKIAEFL